MNTIFDVAQWFIANGTDITHKKLQKLCYYAYAWYLTLYNASKDDITVRFFNEKFEAWVHGAVCPKLYDKYKVYGANVIPQQPCNVEFGVNEMEVLNQVLEVYDIYSGNDLESICHQESPWKNARKNLLPYEPSHNIIADADIFECYGARL